MKPAEVTTIRVSTKLRSALKIAAALQGRKMQQLVDDAVAMYLRKKGRKS